MTAPQRALDVSLKQSQDTLQVCLLGEFDVAGVGAVEEALDRAFHAPTRRVVVDLRRLTFLATAGLATILRADQRARAGGFELVVVRPRGTANRIFTLTHIGRGLSLVDEPRVMA
jgi:anti-sigma B factor antagonist